MGLLHNLPSRLNRYKFWGEPVSVAQLTRTYGNQEKESPARNSQHIILVPEITKLPIQPALKVSFSSSVS